MADINTRRYRCRYPCQRLLYCLGERIAVLVVGEGALSCSRQQGSHVVPAPTEGIGQEGDTITEHAIKNEGLPYAYGLYTHGEG